MLDVTTYLGYTGVALLCGIITAFAFSYRHEISKSFFVSLIVLPMIVNTVIIMVNGSIGVGIAVAGAFSLVRFRSAAGKARDISAIFLVMAAGLTCATGYIWIALLFTCVVNAVIILLNFVPFGTQNKLRLVITIPESLNYANEFDDLFEEYTKNHTLEKTKTTNMGSLYKLYYKFEPKSNFDSKSFIDKLRCRNGNLEIMISETVEDNDDL